MQVKATQKTNFSPEIKQATDAQALILCFVLRHIASLHPENSNVTKISAVVLRHCPPLMQILINRQRLKDADLTVQ